MFKCNCPYEVRAGCSEPACPHYVLPRAPTAAGDAPPTQAMRKRSEHDEAIAIGARVTLIGTVLTDEYVEAHGNYGVQIDGDPGRPALRHFPASALTPNAPATGAGFAAGMRRASEIARQRAMYLSLKEDYGDEVIQARHEGSSDELRSIADAILAEIDIPTASDNPCLSQVATGEPCEPNADNLRRCNICGFIIDVSFEATKPAVDFTMAGRAKPKNAPPASEGEIEAVHAPREPTKAMLIAARDWSAKYVGSPIGNEAATGCWQAMFDAALSRAREAESAGEPLPWESCYGAQELATDPTKILSAGTTTSPGTVGKEGPAQTGAGLAGELERRVAKLPGDRDGGFAFSCFVADNAPAILAALRSAAAAVEAQSELVEALRPFADEAERLDDAHAKMNVDDEWDALGAVIKMGDLRRARAVLAKLASGGEGDVSR